MSRHATNTHDTAICEKVADVGGQTVVFGSRRAQSLPVTCSEAGTFLELCKVRNAEVGTILNFTHPAMSC